MISFHRKMPRVQSFVQSSRSRMLIAASAGSSAAPVSATAPSVRRRL
jgi:hypothetical protein